MGDESCNQFSLKDHPNLIIQSSTVWNDFITLMNSEAIATSGVGTFALPLLS